MLDDTCYFIGFDDLAEAIVVWAILNSEKVQQLMRAMTFTDSKRPYTKQLLMRIAIDKVAQDMSYQDILNQISHLAETLRKDITKEKWETFVNSLLQHQTAQTEPLSTPQLSLFAENTV